MLSDSWFSECPLINGAVSTSKSKFDDKIEASSAKMYFHYYGQLLHQQNMLQDFVRTGTCYSAVIENRADFLGRVVVDVGAGSGILSLFAAQVIKGKVEDVELPEKADILISEPMDGR
ncbi:probable histone-arginine methyltransferase CARM1 [Lycium barbarum]|uniref:probable histone-arginine methyltransferase CARM1 n=1 Tax=Lycium barbarum TaxID=112863 RepID=UPI00293F091E|nr:probable histone-arginine methyltransferase CARM1 [Lycium barbarum]